MKLAFVLLTVLISNVEADVSEAAKNRPVTKVINLLKDMVKQLEKEGEDEEEIFEKMGCWCVTNEKAKTQSIAEAQTQVEDLTSSIEALTADSSKLTTQIGTLEKEVAANTEALETATATREKETADFNEYEKSQIVAIEQLKAAVIALSKVHDASLVQGSQKSSTKKVGPSPGFAKQIEAQARRAHMHDAVLLQVSDKTSLKGSDAEDEDDDDDADLPDHMDFSKPAYLQTAQRGGGHSANKGSAVLRWAKRMHKVEPDEVAHMEPPPSDQAAFRSFSPKVQALLSHALSGVDTALLQQGAAAPASGEIFGVLKQMKENEETNLNEARQAETKASADYDALKEAKESEIKAGTESIDTKTEELAVSDQKSAEAKEILENTQATLDVDTKFLADLKVRCSNMDEQFAERKVNRQNEIEAVSKALAFLSSDEAHELFTRTFNPVFIQRSQRFSRRVTAMRRLLHKVGIKRNLPELAMMAAQVLADPNNPKKDDPTFKKVRGTVDEMVEKLRAQQNAEMKKKDYCVEQLDQNEHDQEMKTRDKNDLTAAIEDLKLTIETLDKELESLKKEITDLTEEMKLAKENRAKENKEFENTVADQRATAKLLTAALGILEGFYGKAALLQTVQYTAREEFGQGQAPPPGFGKMEKSAASGGVMGMMQGIIKEAEEMEAEAVRGEEAAQKDYDDFAMETGAAIEQKSKESVTKQSDKGKAEQDLIQKEKEMEDAMTEFEQLENEEKDLHQECDFVMKNFEKTQAARENEIEGLRQTVRIFGGAAAFLQRGQAFTDFLQQQGLF